MRCLIPFLQMKSDTRAIVAHRHSDLDYCICSVCVRVCRKKDVFMFVKDFRALCNDVFLINAYHLCNPIE